MLSDLLSAKLKQEKNELTFTDFLLTHLVFWEVWSIYQWCRVHYRVSHHWVVHGSFLCAGSRQRVCWPLKPSVNIFKSINNHLSCWTAHCSYAHQAPALREALFQSSRMPRYTGPPPPPFLGYLELSENFQSEECCRLTLYRLFKGVFFLSLRAACLDLIAASKLMPSSTVSSLSPSYWPAAAPVIGGTVTDPIVEQLGIAQFQNAKWLKWSI